MNRLERFILYWLPAIGCAILIFVISSMPHIGSETKLFPHSDKALHFFEYAVFGFLLIRAYSSERTGKKPSHVRIIVLLAVILYAVTDEVHQYFVPGRSMEFLDLVSDSIGAFFGQMLFKVK